MLLARPLAGVHFGRLVAGLEFLGQLGKGEAQLRVAHAFRFLAEELVAQQVELLPQGGVFLFGPSQRVLQLGDARCAPWRDR